VKQCQVTAAPGIEIPSQHHAFLVSEDQFDVIFARLLAASLELWADPQCSEPGTYNQNQGGRGVYLRDPAGHGLEVLTRRIPANRKPCPPAATLAWLFATSPATAPYGVASYNSVSIGKINGRTFEWR
jgi:hypothetical protein